ncbi:hypothetical protein [Secundilactobacillus collinoides]|uniref:hypothetical protein n=1 Tax=Secundilactobacillus collinoides TaxID=33960 RepID=UPI0006D17D73|nr:hypothetical protein [Secundilactobacillus collinoides]
MATAGFATKADAASYAKVTSNSLLKTDATTRNVAPNGTNALYTKAGTLKGAKLVATKTTMANLAKSKSSKNYFRAYQVAKTNRGSVYYKIVSFDGKYRGWIYGGKSTTAFGGGIASANTTKTATTPTTTTGYTIKNVKSNTIWNNPVYTQYKASKINMSAYKSTDTFTVSAAETKTREGSLYYKVTDDQTPSITGWIYAKGLAQDTNSVTVNYVDIATTKSVGTLNLPFSTYASSATAASTNLTSGTAFTAILKGIPTGYVANDTDNNSSASFANLTDAAAAKSGSTVNFYVKSSSTATDKTQSISFNLRYASDKQTPITNATIQAALSTVGKEAQYQIATGTSITNTQVLNILKAANADSFTFTGKDNNQYVATYSSFDADPAGTGANVQLQVNAYYTVTAVK